MTAKTAGYSGTPLARKLGIKSGFRAIVLGAPKNYFELIDDAPSDVIWIDVDEGRADFLHFFSDSRSELEHMMPLLKKAIVKDGMLWISWPKKSSGVETDLDGNVVRDTGLGHGLVDVKVCAVDETWSALKFVYRVTDR
ncbi:MAG: DUF3052 domain-containing protein [Rhodothermia bacterium]|nr:DUF3052 domain-containing protein [Rhodothermia bacterium]